MSGIQNTRCEFSLEVETARIETRNKAAADWDSALAPVYVHTACELQRIIMRHAKRCPICPLEDGLSQQEAA